MDWNYFGYYENVFKMFIKYSSTYLIIFICLDECFNSFQMIIKIQYTRWRYDPIRCRYMGCECNGFNPHVMCADVCADCHHDKASHIWYGRYHVVLCISTFALKRYKFSRLRQHQNKAKLKNSFVSTFISNCLYQCMYFQRELWII